MNPFYFSDSQTPLYGVLHEPTDGPFRNKAILFCHPLGHEYFRTHRMIQLLASKLASQGYYCLRFDYHGTGDSSGQFEQVDLNTWQQDINDACTELRSTAGCEQILCIGVRLGAALALQANTQCHFNEFIFWDPIFEGQHYLQQLNELQTQVLKQNWHFSIVRDPSDLSTHELLGYNYNALLQQQLKELSLSNKLLALTTPFTIIHTGPHNLLNEIKPQNTKDSVTIKHINDEGGWEAQQDIDRSISTHNINQFILETLS